MKRIIFLCSGNTSRSPMAEGIFKKMTRNIDIISAGFSTKTGEAASENAILVCRKHGIDLTEFKTTNIRDIDFSSDDLILTATKSAREKIKKLHPCVDAYTIREYAGDFEKLDIEDPSEDSLGDHVVCFFEIRQALKKIIETHDEFEGFANPEFLIE